MLGVVRRNPEFGKLWLSQLVSQFGNWLNRIAILALIGSLSGEEGGAQAVLGLGALYAFELAIRMLPAAVFGPLAGPLADRISRLHLMIASDVLRALVVLAMVWIREAGQLPILYTLLVAQMSLSVFFEAARSASVPNTVAKEDLHEAYALSAVTWSLMLTLGTLASAAGIQLLGVRGLFVADAATYLISVGFLLRLKLPPMPVQVEPFRWRDVFLMTELRRALEHVRGLGLLPVLATKSFWGPAGGFLVVLALAGKVRFAGEDAATGGEGLAVAAGSATAILYAARGLGTGIGPILGRRLLGSTDRGLRLAIHLGFLVAAVGYAFFGFTTTLGWASAWVLFAHVGGSAVWVSSTTIWQRRVDDAFRGRVFALEFLGMTLAISLFGAVAGLLFDLSQSLRLAVWALSGLVLILGALWGVAARRSGP